jgi:hypothetical protein
VVTINDLAARVCGPFTHLYGLFGPVAIVIAIVIVIVIVVSF